MSWFADARKKLVLKKLKPYRTKQGVYEIGDYLIIPKENFVYTCINCSHFSYPADKNYVNSIKASGKHEEIEKDVFVISGFAEIIAGGRSHIFTDNWERLTYKHFLKNMLISERGKPVK